MTADLVPNCSFLPFLFMFYVDCSLETPASKWYYSCTVLPLTLCHTTKRLLTIPTCTLPLLIEHLHQDLEIRDPA